MGVLEQEHLETLTASAVAPAGQGLLCSAILFPIRAITPSEHRFKPRNVSAQASELKVEKLPNNLSLSLSLSPSLWASILRLENLAGNDSCMNSIWILIL